MCFFFFSFLQLQPPLLPNPPSSGSQLHLRTLTGLINPDQLPPPGASTTPSLPLCCMAVYKLRPGPLSLFQAFCSNVWPAASALVFSWWSGLGWSCMLPPRLPCLPLTGIVGLGVGFQGPGTSYAWNLVPSPVGSSCLLLLLARSLHGGCPL